MQVFLVFTLPIKLFADTPKTPPQHINIDASDDPIAGLIEDVGFRYVKGKCMALETDSDLLIKKGDIGYNPHFLGQCGDLRNMDLSQHTELYKKDLRGAIYNENTLFPNGFNLKKSRMKFVKTPTDTNN